MEIFESKTDIGLIREKNEDAAIVLQHPKNKNIRLILGYTILLLKICAIQQ